MDTCRVFIGRSLLVVSLIWLAMDQTPTSGWTRGTPSAALKTSLAIDWDTMQVCPRMQKCPTIISNRQWNPPIPTSADLIAVWRKLDKVQIIFQDHDEIVWKPSPNGLYSLRSAWNQVRVSYPAVSWHSIVWFKEIIPSQAVSSALAFLSRLLCYTHLTPHQEIQTNFVKLIVCIAFSERESWEAAS